MNIWITNQFRGNYPVGTAAVIVAETIEKAIELLEADLKYRGIPQEIRPKQLRLLNTSIAHSVVLNDGEY